MPPIQHLEKVLRHAERKLEDVAHQKPTDFLDVYRKFIKLEEHRLKLAHQSGEGGREVVQKRADFMTVVLRQVFRGAWESSQKDNKKKRPPLAMIAVGGFGRREMNPFSDVDILFLHGKASKEESSLLHEAIEQVLYMLWDVGFD